ncbi:S1/P1 nuclease [Sphingomonas sp. PR090111-T3T-6A]|uniref:S1/P1 nuclease n=1 Tax=Sphingomonas sp. PR090111-T3T-6A TaxID=685778 RepID=UPI00039F5BD8
MNRLQFLLAAIVALLLPLSPAAAWWEYGHETVARIAYLEVNPETRAGIDGLLRQSKLLDTPTCPAKTIAEASVWPDCVKNLGDRFSYAYNWHFVDIDVCKPFDPKGPCAGGNCVISQIERNQRLLADKHLNPRERLMALIFLVHFVGDLHQPLHAAERDGDQGGNKLRTHYGVMAGRTNLHSIWDGLLADRAISTPPGDAKGLLAGTTPESRAAMQTGTVTDWAKESWELARDTVYPTATHGPACPPTRPADAGLDEATIQQLIPVLRQQVLRGGLRLAKMLDDAFAGHVPPRPKYG